MSAGKTISLYLESQERSLPLPARAAEELFEPALSLSLSLLSSSFATILLYGGDRMEADSLPGINYAEGNSLPFATLNSNPLFNYFLHATKYNNKPSSGKKISLSWVLFLE